MDELFRLNVVRPPNATSSRGVPLDYALLQTPYPATSLLGLIAANPSSGISGGGGGGARGGAGAAPVKAVARAAVSAVTGIFRTHADMLADARCPSLRRFLQGAQDLCQQLGDAAGTQPHNEVVLSGADLARLRALPDFATLKAEQSQGLSLLLVRSVDSFLAQFITPRPAGPSLGVLGDLIRSVRLALRLVGQAPDFVAPVTLADLDDATSGALMLPPALQLASGRVQPIGVADLLVVKQRLLRYDTADIQQIENILLREKRQHTLKHSLTSESETTSETESQTETETSLTSTDRSNLKNEITSLLKETIDVKANLELGYGEAKAGTWHFKASAGVQYTRVSEESAKFASEIAKDVTQKASSKITERVKNTRRTKLTEVVEDLEDKGFDNTTGTGHVRGVYQFLNKVYVAQVFNYGKRLLFDINVPEPARYLLEVNRSAVRKSDAAPPLPLKWVSFAGSSGLPNRPLAAGDDEAQLVKNGATVFDLLPDHLRPDATDKPTEGVLYSEWQARYGVSGIQASPEMFKSVGLAHARDVQKDANAIVIEDQIQLPDGYRADGADVTAGWRHLTGDDGAEESAVVTVRLADAAPFLSYDLASSAAPPVASSPLQLAKHLTSDGDVTQDNFSADRQHISFTLGPAMIVGTVPVAISASKVDHVTVNIVVHCIRIDSCLRKWQLETYAHIVERYNDLQEVYRRALAASALANAGLDSPGRNPDTNRKTEQIELKRSSINILTAHGGQELLGREATEDFAGAQDAQGNALPLTPPVSQPRLPAAIDTGRLVRFFEQAFEWDKIGYVFYPYFWSRMDRWAERLQLTDSDPLFEQFLRAGYARVLIPVRPGFEQALMYYLLWDEPWEGGDLPAIGDPLYLPITEEIRQQSGAPGAETPQGEPWEVVVPTDLIYLRKNDDLPEWQWVGHDADIAHLRQGAWSWEEKS